MQANPSSIFRNLAKIERFGRFVKREKAAKANADRLVTLIRNDGRGDVVKAYSYGARDDLYTFLVMGRDADGHAAALDYLKETLEPLNIKGLTLELDSHGVWIKGPVEQEPFARALKRLIKQSLPDEASFLQKDQPHDLKY